MQHEYTLHDDDFRKIAELVAKTTGIVIDERKRAFVHGRLGRRLRNLGLSDFRQYCRLLDGPNGADEHHLLVNAITTNHTSFFREPHHFEFMTKTMLPGIVQANGERAGRLRIWSAGCSTGEEPYTMAMTLRDCDLPLHHWDTRILATDLDTNVVAHAAAGVYDMERIQSIPRQAQKQYISVQSDGRAAMSDELRSLITFKQLNLLEEWPMNGPFDIIFCRNVVIYFNKETQRRLFDRYADMLRPQGWLVVGHSESLTDLTDRFDLVGRTIYRRTK